MGNSNINQDDIYHINPGVYKPTNIYGRSVDTKGHQVHKRLNLPPSLMNAVNVVHGKLGYDTPESFIRDSIVHRLHFWQNQPGCPPEIEGMVALVEAQARFSEFEAMRQELNSLRQNIGAATGITREFMLTQLVIFRDNLPDYLSGFLDEVTQLIKTYE